jgi:hypothetical protein
MAGAHCMYCDQRCFVYRQVIVGSELIWAGHMATCARGRERDRKEVGVDHTQAHNPMEREADR